MPTIKRKTASGFDLVAGGISATDKAKLDGIEASADVTDATNVDAAGAVMESDTTTASMSFVVDEDDMVSDSATKVPTQQSVKAYSVPKSTVTTKGDLIVGTASATVARRAIGTNGQVLTADSAEADGVKWATPSAETLFNLPPPGSWIVGTGNTGVTISQNETPTGVWLFVPAAVAIDRIGVEITGAAAAGHTIEFGLYKLTGRTTLERVFDTSSGPVAADSTGVKEVVISQTLTAGRYVAFSKLTAGGSTVSLRARSGGFMGAYPADVTERDSDSRSGVHPSQVGNPTAWASSFTLGLGFRSHASNVWLRVA